MLRTQADTCSEKTRRRAGRVRTRTGQILVKDWSCGGLSSPARASPPQVNFEMACLKDANLKNSIVKEVAEGWGCVSGVNQV